MKQAPFLSSLACLQCIHHLPGHPSTADKAKYRLKVSCVLWVTWSGLAFQGDEFHWLFIQSLLEQSLYTLRAQLFYITSWCQIFFYTSTWKILCDDVYSTKCSNWFDVAMACLLISVCALLVSMPASVKIVQYLYLSCTIVCCYTPWVPMMFQCQKTKTT